MKNYIPKIYKKDIFDIDYEYLKKKNIKCIIFDLDNTIMTIDEEHPKKKVLELINKLKKDFIIYVLSNNKSKERVKKAGEYLEVGYFNLALKPLGYGFKRVLRKEKLKVINCCNIGDQLVTDILGGNRLGLLTILVDPIAKKELKVTKINRYIEAKKLKKLKEKNLFNRGEYYGG